MLYLGEPDPEDIEQAAWLWLRYEREGGLPPDAAEVFWKMCSDPDAVRRRVDHLRTVLNNPRLIEDSKGYGIVGLKPGERFDPIADLRRVAAEKRREEEEAKKREGGGGEQG